MSGHLDGPPPGPPDPPYEQRIAALDDLVQRAWSLIAGAMSGNPHKPIANSEWMDAARRWEIDFCMGQGSSVPEYPTVSYRVRDRDSDYKAMCHEDRDHAELLLKAWLANGRDAVIERRHVFDGGWLPVGRPFFTEQQERMLDRCEAFDNAVADRAAADEDWREARALAAQLADALRDALAWPPHRYEGWCPDETAPDSSDMDCPRCVAEINARRALAVFDAKENPA